MYLESSPACVFDMRENTLQCDSHPISVDTYSNSTMPTHRNHTLGNVPPIRANTVQELPEE
jgi:hypothetical protein